MGQVIDRGIGRGIVKPSFGKPAFGRAIGPGLGRVKPPTIGRISPPKIGRY